MIAFHKNGLRSRDLFVPKAALYGNHASLFSGRTTTVTNAFNALTIPGTTAVIYGDRGIGKSSLAWQLFELLQGNKEVAQFYPHISVHDEYTCFWLECEQRYDNISGVLLSLLRKTNSKKGVTLHDKFPDVFDSKSIEAIERSYEINAVLAKARFKFGTSDVSANELTEALKAVQSSGLSDPYELFGTMLSLVKKQRPDHEVVIFLDEFDRLPNHDGMGDFIKHCGDARTVIIGVAETAEELIGQHPSAERKLLGATIEVPPLKAEEIKGIYDKASRIVSNYHGYQTLIFDASFTNEAIEASGGYPALAQLIGYQAIEGSSALLRAKTSSVTIAKSEFDAAIQQIFANSSDARRPELNEKLKAAVGQSTKRAGVLDHLSAFDAGWIELSRFRSNLPASLQDGFAIQLRLLVQSGILKQSDVNNRSRIGFSTPIMRYLVRLAKQASSLYPIQVGDK